jgi:hypothetical protein
MFMIKATSNRWLFYFIYEKSPPINNSKELNLIFFCSFFCFLTGVDMSELSVPRIEKMIYVIRGQKVMLDSDLANLYEVDTGQLNRQVRRNINRFPVDFMFELTQDEHKSLICQIGISKKGRGGRQKLPLVFTEPGVAMLSSVLNSERAVMVNISIIRTFIKLRSYLSMENTLEEKVNKLQEGTNKLFKVVFERLDSVEEATPALRPNRKKIGLRVKN